MDAHIMALKWKHGWAKDHSFTFSPYHDESKSVSLSLSQKR